ncbi:hypothetical protein [Nitrospira sp. Kam-Ns4a]
MMPIISMASSRAGRALALLPLLVFLAGCAGPIGPAHCDPARAAHEAQEDRALKARMEIDEPQADKGPSPDGIAAIALMEKKILDERACRQAIDPVTKPEMTQPC